MVKLDFAGYDGRASNDMNVPEHTRNSLRMYVEEGYDPGGFVTAVLCNNLIDAVSRADSVNINHLRDITMFVYNRMPGGSWGSKEKMAAWVKQVWESKDGTVHN